MDVDAPKPDSFQAINAPPDDEIMAVVYPFSAKQIVKALYFCLEQFNTVIKIKSQDYKLKCYHKNTIKMTKYNSSMELFNDFNQVNPTNYINLGN
jgi:5'-AMP-activated protein kinase catalytic alpha subunit